MKFAVSILLVGLSFRLLFSQSTTGFSKVAQNPFIDKTMSPESTFVKDFEDRDHMPPKVGDMDQVPPDLVDFSEARDQFPGTGTQALCYYESMLFSFVLDH